MPIGRNTKDRKKMAVIKTGKEAITNFKVIKRYIGFTLIEVKIETGRTHQIRVHLSEIGFPVIGDEQYSNGKNPFGIKRPDATCKKIRVYTSNDKKTIRIWSTNSKIFSRGIRNPRKG